MQRGRKAPRRSSTEISLFILCSQSLATAEAPILVQLWQHPLRAAISSSHRPPAAACCGHISQDKLQLPSQASPSRSARFVHAFRARYLAWGTLMQRCSYKPIALGVSFQATALLSRSRPNKRRAAAVPACCAAASRLGAELERRGTEGAKCGAGGDRGRRGRVASWGGGRKRCKRLSCWDAAGKGRDAGLRARQCGHLRCSAARCRLPLRGVGVFSRTQC